MERETSTAAHGTPAVAKPHAFQLAATTLKTIVVYNGQTPPRLETYRYNPVVIGDPAFVTVGYQNQGTHALAINAYGATLERGDHGRGPCQLMPSSWISVSPSVFRLGPGKSVRERARFHIPAGAHGEHDLLIMLHGRTVGGLHASGLTLSGQVASVLDLKMPGPASHACLSLPVPQVRPASNTALVVGLAASAVLVLALLVAVLMIRRRRRDPYRAPRSRHAH
jgi:hypothetical protein